MKSFELKGNQWFLNGDITFKEAARDILSDYKQRGSEFKSDPIKISEEIFKRRHHDYKIADTLNCKENLAFYDRGIHEITAYLRSIDNSSSYWDNLPSNYKYDLIFIFQPKQCDNTAGHSNNDWDHIVYCRLK